MLRRLPALLLATLAAAPLAAAGAAPSPSLTLQTLDGEGTVGVDSFRGRPVLLTFWASWCGPCREELPELGKLYGELAGKGFVLLTVNVDASPSVAERFIQRMGLSLPVYRMSPRDLAALGVDGLPTNILLDAEGRIVQVYAGYDPELPGHIRSRVLAMVEPSGGSQGP